MRWAERCWRWGGAAIWIAAIVVPLLALVVDVATGPAPKGRWWLTSRQLVLLGKTVGLATVAAAVTVLVALPTVPAVCRIERRGGRGLIYLALVLPLLMPPYVFAFGWDRLLTPWMVRHLGDASGWARAVLVWVSWAWPIPSMLVATGWRDAGHAAYQAALLDTHASAAFRRAALPVLAGHVATAAGLLWALFLIEYNAPHACSIQVFATELLAWAQASRHAVDVVARAAPLVGLVAVVVGLLLWRYRGSAAEDDRQEPAASLHGARGRSILPVLVVLGGLVVLPIGGLIGRLASWQSFQQLWLVYGGEILESLAIAAGVGVTAIWMGTWLASRARWRWLRGGGIAATVALGIMPAAIVGQTMVIAYRRADLVYDHWPVMILTQVARWGWIGWLAGWLVVRSTPVALTDQARTDGAAESTAEIAVGWRGQWMTLAAAAAVIAALSLGEVAAMSIVRPPGIGWIAQTLMEKFHRFEDQMLVTISLVLACAPLPGLILGWTAWRWRGHD